MKSFFFGFTLLAAIQLQGCGNSLLSNTDADRKGNIDEKGSFELVTMKFEPLRDTSLCPDEMIGVQAIFKNNDGKELQPELGRVVCHGKNPAYPVPHFDNFKGTNEEVFCKLLEKRDELRIFDEILTSNIDATIQGPSSPGEMIALTGGVNERPQFRPRDNISNKSTLTAMIDDPQFGRCDLIKGEIEAKTRLAIASNALSVVDARPLAVAKNLKTLVFLNTEIYNTIALHDLPNLTFFRTINNTLTNETIHWRQIKK